MNNQFAFHMGILHDQVFIQYLFSNGRSPFTPDYDDIDDFSWCDCNVRLTAQGHDFLAALRQKNIWKAVKEDLKENSIETVWKLAQAMATKLATSKLEKYLDATDVK